MISLVSDVDHMKGHGGAITMMTAARRQGAGVSVRRDIGWKRNPRAQRESSGGG